MKIFGYLVLIFLTKFNITEKRWIKIKSRLLYSHWKLMLKSVLKKWKKASKRKPNNNCNKELKLKKNQKKFCCKIANVCALSSGKFARFWGLCYCWTWLAAKRFTWHNQRKMAARCLHSCRRSWRENILVFLVK